MESLTRSQYWTRQLKDPFPRCGEMHRGYWLEVGNRSRAIEIDFRAWRHSGPSEPAKCNCSRWIVRPIPAAGIQLFELPRGRNGNSVGDDCAYDRGIRDAAARLNFNTQKKLQRVCVPCVGQRKASTGSTFDCLSSFHCPCDRGLRLREHRAEGREGVLAEERVTES